MEVQAVVEPVETTAVTPVAVVKSVVKHVVRSAFAQICTTGASVALPRFVPVMAKRVDVRVAREHANVRNATIVTTGPAHDSLPFPLVPLVLPLIGKMKHGLRDLSATVQGQGQG